MNLLFHRSNMKLNTADNNSSEDNDNDNDIQSGNISSDGTVLIDSNNSSENNDWKFNYHGDYKDKNLRPICTEDLILWAFQVARGMEYLTQRKVLHGDLAARNILLTDGNIVKICDFGLARNIYDKAIYTKKTDSPLPIKWMAIESIRDRIFSTQSDVWSFGIVLWELFTLGATPYPGMEAQTQYQKLINGYRMEKPLYATNEIYQIMLNCWHELPIYRQSFTQIVKKLSEFLDEKIVIHYINLNLPYIKSNTQQLENGRKDYLSLMTAPDYEILSSMIYPDTDTPPLKIYSTTNNNKRMFKFPNNHNDDDDNNCDDKLSEELSMINHEDDNYYLTPINIHDRRREFERMQSNKSIDNSHNNKNNNRLNYYNTQELDKILKAKIDDDDVYKKKNTKEDFDERKAVELGNIEADSFSNPSYMMDGWLKPMKATRV